MQIVVLTRRTCLLQASETPTRGGAGVENYGVAEEKDI